jgi:glucose-1-phosphate adenylyltransferase
MVLVVSGDHISSMDYRRIIEFHRARNADATVSLIRVSPESVKQFGIAEIDGTGKIHGWVEKPITAKSNLASMGVYVFRKEPLAETITEAAREGGVDFAKDIIPRMLQNRRVYGFTFDGYWRDVGTIHSYWSTNMDMLDPESGLNIADWRIKTKLSAKGEVGDRPSAYIGRNARITNSLVARGCIIEGEVKNSILSPGVRVAEKTRIIDSVIFHDSQIDTKSLVQCCIIDKQVCIGEAVQIGMGELIPNKKFPDHLSTGISIIGKQAVIESGLTIGKNCVINPDVHVTQMEHPTIPSGSIV